MARKLEKDGEFGATFVRGVTGRSPSARRSAFLSKVMHEHLATDARIKLWGGRERGTVACGCGTELTWVDRTGIGELQWHVI